MSSKRQPLRYTAIWRRVESRYGGLNGRYLIHCSSAYSSLLSTHTQTHTLTHPKTIAKIEAKVQLSNLT